MSPQIYVVLWAVSIVYTLYHSIKLRKWGPVILAFVLPAITFLYLIFLALTIPEI